MSDPFNFNSQARVINERIRLQVAELSTLQPLTLPTAEAAIVESFVEKIAGAYYIPDFQGDTNHAVDLLFIAYNVTPQDQGAIRIQINSIMDRLIEAQQQSERVSQQAATVAQEIYMQLGQCLSTWLGAKQRGDYAAVRAFVTDPLLTLARDIGIKAEHIARKLQSIADRYDERLGETLKVHADSEAALAEAVKADAAFAAQRDATERRRKALDTVIANMRKDVGKLEALIIASKFPMGDLLRSGSQWVSLLIPFPVFQRLEQASWLAASRFGNALSPPEAGTEENHVISPKKRKDIVQLYLGLLGNVSKYDALMREDEEEKIKAKKLLAGRSHREQSAALAVQAFNLSLQALTRNREIVEVIAFFFSSLSTFISAIIDETNVRIEQYERTEQEDRSGSHQLAHLVKSTDELLIEYAGQWLAVERLAKSFEGTFKAGWTRLNILSGDYVRSSELSEHLQDFIKRLDEIAAARKQRADARSVDVQTSLQAFRDYLVTS